MSPGPPETDAVRRLLGDVQRLGLATAASVIDRFSGMVRGLGNAGRVADGSWAAAAATTAARVMMHAPSPNDVETVVLSTVPDRGVAAGTAWLHNTTVAEATDLTLHCTALVGPGVAIPPSAVTLAPSDVAALPAGASLAIGVEVMVPPDQPAGSYHGLLVMSGPPDGAVVLRLAVAPSEDPE